MRTVSSALLCAFLVLCAPAVFAQGITTGSLSGTITDQEGAVLPGVIIEAVHQPTGTRYSTVSRSDGRYAILNVRVGGPYTVKANLDGFQPQEKTNIFVDLGEDTVVNFQLSLGAIEETLTVVADANPVIDSTHYGAASNVSSEAIDTLPTVGRGLEDFARLNPNFATTASNDGPTSITVAGRNNRYNSILIDGAVNNDLFGLADSGTPGGQAETQPVSIDAIDSLQLLVSPYDVRQGGFSGGGINAITKSGTNAFKGSVYGYTRDQSFVGDLDGRDIADFSQDQYGLSVGGPISKDKIFFFFNGEISRRDQPTGFSINGSGQQFGHLDEVNTFRNILIDRYGFDPGGLDEQIRGTDSDKYFGRIDFNLSDGQQLRLRHNYVDASNDIIRPNAFTYDFESYTYQFLDKTNSTVAQLNSVFGNFYNEGRLTYQTIRDNRSPINGVRFPYVRVEFSDGTRVEAGSERFSTANALDQDIIEFTDDLTWIHGDHTVTVGTHNEFFKFRNLFIRENFGAYTFNSLENFEAGLADTFAYSFSNTSDPQQAAEFNAYQLGLYAGDQWKVRPELTVYYGLRVDAPFFPDDPTRNPLTEQVFGLRTDTTPDGNLLWSPRIGFNWDIGGTGEQQLRGGIGIFSGKAPYVWLSNQYSNTGIEFTRLSAFGGGIPFVADPDGQPKSIGGASTSEVDLIDPDFKLPQVLRVTLGYDRQLGFWDLIGSAEVIWADTQEDILYQNLNYEQSGTLFDGRKSFTQVDRTFSDAIFLTNTSEGDQLSASIKIERPFRDGLFGFISYAYGDSNSINDGTSSQAVSNWRFLPSIDPNNPEVSPSNFDIAHRFNAALSYRFGARNFPTTVSFFYNAQSGRPFSTTFSNDINGDRQDNDLLYVPASADEVIVTNGTWEDLNNYISADSGLSAARGKIVKRNASRAPWTQQLDFKLAQDVRFGKYAFQITLDILNFWNLIDSDAGRVQYVPFAETSPVRFDGIDAATGKPIYRLNFTDPDRRFSTDDLRSRWQAQLGLRFSF
ncbi:MAG: TonB-dependent receptor [Acidobacteria bacterium]|nr:TonB-dependent receptor [Acidobacteriota bacterium]